MLFSPADWLTLSPCHLVTLSSAAAPGPAPPGLPPAPPAHPGWRSNTPSAPGTAADHCLPSTRILPWPTPAPARPGGAPVLPDRSRSSVALRVSAGTIAKCTKEYVRRQVHFLAAFAVPGLLLEERSAMG